MAFDELLAERITECLKRRKNITSKKMFGGLVFLLKGNILVGVWKESMIARVGADEYEPALLEPHVKPFDITGKAMTGWVLISPKGLETDEQLQRWIQQAMEYVTTLPGK